MGVFVCPFICPFFFFLPLFKRKELAEFPHQPHDDESEQGNATAESNSAEVHFRLLPLRQRLFHRVRYGNAVHFNNLFGYRIVNLSHLVSVTPTDNQRGVAVSLHIDRIVLEHRVNSFHRHSHAVRVVVVLLHRHIDSPLAPIAERQRKQYQHCRHEKRNRSESLFGVFTHHNTLFVSSLKSICSYFIISASSSLQ